MTKPAATFDISFTDGKTIHCYVWRSVRSLRHYTWSVFRTHDYKGCFIGTWDFKARGCWAEVHVTLKAGAGIVAHELMHAMQSWSIDKYGALLPYRTKSKTGVVRLDFRPRMRQNERIAWEMGCLNSQFWDQYYKSILSAKPGPKGKR